MTENLKHSQRLEQNKQEEPMTMAAKVATIGLFAGVFWSLLAYFAYLFNFTELSPNLVLQPWTVGEWRNGQLGQFIGIALIGLISIGVAFIYYALLKKFENIWAGIFFGLVLWAFVFYVLNPLFPGLKTVNQLERNTIITTLCFYTLYGLFIGYSISFEASELNRQRNAIASNK